jgi:phospholipase D1/2
MACVGGLDLCFGRWDTPAHPIAGMLLASSLRPGTHVDLDTHPVDFSATLFPGQDYNNARVLGNVSMTSNTSLLTRLHLDFQRVDNFASNQVSILETPRMGWHDVHMSLVGPAVLDIVQHFVERWNELKKRKYNGDTRYDWLALPHDIEAAPNEAVARKFPSVHCPGLSHMPA